MRNASGVATRNLLAVAALSGLALSTAAQDVVRDRVQASYGGGNSVFVQVIPDGRAAMQFEREGPAAWVFRGDSSALVGKSYTIRLENNGSSRIKVVVGVDGVNVYFRKPIQGTADGDIGSILGPGQRRVLTGFQADEQTAQRFVFSPPEYSEGAPVRGRIGEIHVHVYEEYRPSYRDRSSESTKSAPSAGAAPEIGTTSGEDVDSEIRRVRFTAATREPEVRLVLAYGRPDPDQGQGPDDRVLRRLGVAVERHPDGLRIVRVETGGLGDDVGLRDGDTISKVDTTVRPSEGVLRRILRDKRSGEYLFLEVRRGRHIVNFKIRL